MPNTKDDQKGGRQDERHEGGSTRSGGSQEKGGKNANQSRGSMGDRSGGQKR